ncbi:MAG: DUF86 domain-containing protein, partial [Candidatus Mcinerneyibacterium aminivorans]
MDKELLLSKIDSLARSIKRIENKTPETVKKLKNDYDLQDIIALNLQRAVQISVDIATHIIANSNEKVPSSMAECFDSLKNLNVINKELSNSLKSAVGFRNISVHEYQKIDWEIVYSIINNNIDDFR